MKAAAEGHAMESNPKKLRIAEPTDLISFLKAEEILKRRFPNTTREEVEMWAFLGKVAFPDESDEWVLIGPNAGGFTSYFYDAANATEIDSFILCGKDIGEKEVNARLMKSMFSNAEIEGFNPDERWIPYRTLLQQWTERVGENDAEALINSNADSGELEEYYPFAKNCEIKGEAIFSLKQLLQIERNALPEVGKYKSSTDEAHASEAQPSSPTAPLESTDERRSKIDLTRERGARRRILEKWDDIEKEYGPKPDAHEFLRVLKRDQDEKLPVLKTVQNHLWMLRQEKLIP